MPPILQQEDNSLSQVRVSLIVPIYNVAGFLGACLDSIRAQDFPDFEAILVDDGSTDESLRIAEDYAGKDGRFIVLRQANQGAAAARNKGLSIARGTWIMFADSDDVLSPDLLTVLLAQTGGETDIVACCCTAFTGDMQHPDYFFDSDKIFETPAEKKELYKQLMNERYGQTGEVYTAIGVPWGKLYRRQFLEENKLHFFEDLKRFQDNIFNMYAFAYAHRIAYVNKPLYRYRLDHARIFAKTHKPDAESYMVRFCEERYHSAEQLGWLNDAELFAFFREEMLHYLQIILRDGIFPEYHGKACQEEILRLTEMPCFAEVLAGDEAGLSKTGRRLRRAIQNERFLYLRRMMWQARCKIRLKRKMRILLRK